MEQQDKLIAGLLELWDKYRDDEAYRRDDEKCIVIKPSFTNFISWLRHQKALTPLPEVSL